MSLNIYREQIDIIDEQLLSLFKERMGVSKDVALYKKEHNLSVLNAERECDILSTVKEKTDDELRPYILRLYKTILEVSREYQEDVINE